jgi:hypothetical protein
VWAALPLLRAPAVQPPRLTPLAPRRVRAQAGGGIAISGLPARLAVFNATYAPTGALIEGFPSYAAGPTRHLFRRPMNGEWHLSYEPFDPATNACFARIAAAGGPVPTGARVWRVGDGVKWFDAEATAREVA